MASLIWETDGNTDNQAKFKISHEYILVYSSPPPPVMDPSVGPDSKLHNAEIRNTPRRARTQTGCAS